MPTIGAVLKIAKALGISGAELMAEAERMLPPDYWASGS